MGGVSTFIGVPDWRSALLALALVALWLLPLLRRSRLFPALLLALVLGALLFAPAMGWVQVPLQQLLPQLQSLWLTPPARDQPAMLVWVLPSLLVASLVQEAVKLLVSGMAALPGRQRGARQLSLLGAAAGAGFGGFEAFWVFNQIFASGLSLASVQLGGPVVLLGFLERLLTVAFHCGTGALLGYGLGQRQVGSYFALAVGLHTAANYAVMAPVLGVQSPWLIELWVAAWALLTWWLAWSRLRGRISG